MLDIIKRNKGVSGCLHSFLFQTRRLRRREKMEILGTPQTPAEGDALCTPSFRNTPDPGRGRCFCTPSFRNIPDPGKGLRPLHPYYATGWRIASISTFATSGRENSRGGISPACNIWRTFVPLRVTWSSLLCGQVFDEAIESQARQKKV